MSTDDTTTTPTTATDIGLGGDDVATAAVVPPAAPPPVDASIGEYLRNWLIGLRSGELGVIPILVAIAIIAIYFQSRNDHFLTAGNFVNLISQGAAFAVIGMGIVFVLLLGEIDLSVGYVSGLGGIVAAKLLLPEPAGPEWVSFAGIAVAILAGMAIGAVQGSFVAWVGVPSFVVTLAGYIAVQGLDLNEIGGKGTIIIQDKYVNDLANGFISSGLAWGILIACVIGYCAQQAYAVTTRARAGLPNQPFALIGARIVLVAALGVGLVAWANDDRGIPYVGVVLLGLFLILTFVTQRTTFGRHIYAVGGNAEAARRAGINVPRIRLIVFMISGTMAAFGGIILASRLNSVDTSTGGGSTLLYSIAAAVIGGTSLFGGRGTIRAAILGAIVISMIENGMGLVNTPAGTKYEITGAVLLAAVTLDTVTRRRSAQVGR